MRESSAYSGFRPTHNHRGAGKSPFCLTTATDDHGRKINTDLKLDEKCKEDRAWLLKIRYAISHKDPESFIFLHKAIVGPHLGNKVHACYPLIK